MLANRACSAFEQRHQIEAIFRLVRAKHLYFVLPRAVGDVEITDDVSTTDLVTGFEDYAEVVQCMAA